MTASEYRARLEEAWVRLSGRAGEYAIGQRVGLSDAWALAAKLADPPPPPATAEPGLERSGGRVWGESCKDFPKPADGPAVFLEESAGFYAGAADGVYHSDGRGKWTKVNEAAEATAAPVADVPAEVERLAAVNPFAAYEGFPVTVQEEGGPAITVPPGWRVLKQEPGNHTSYIWLAWFVPVGGDGEDGPVVPVPPGWRSGVGPFASGDIPGAWVCSWERVPAAEPSDGGSGKTFQADPAAVRRAGLLEAAGVCQAERAYCQERAEGAEWTADVWRGSAQTAGILAARLERLAEEA